MAECGGLENRWACKRPVGSNPTLSASLKEIWRDAGVRLNRHDWKSCRGDEPLEGSNPSLSAICK